MSSYDVSIVVPCYNEVGVIDEGFRRIEAVMDKTGYAYEIVLVDDKSGDGTKGKIEDIARIQDNVTAVFHDENRGKGASIVDGIRAAGAPRVGFLDIDLEVSADYLPEFISCLEEGYDIVVGRRKYSKALTIHNISRYFMSRTYGLLVRCYLGLPVKDPQCGFKFFWKDSVQDLIENSQEKRWLWDTEFLLAAYMAGKRIGEVPCVFIRRKDKRSNLNPWVDTVRMFLGVLNLKKGLR